MLRSRPFKRPQKPEYLIHNVRQPSRIVHGGEPASHRKRARFRSWIVMIAVLGLVVAMFRLATARVKGRERQRLREMLQETLKETVEERKRVHSMAHANPITIQPTTSLLSPISSTTAVIPTELIKPPLVTRDMLDRITLSHIDDEDDDEIEVWVGPPEGQQILQRWPPIVTRIPEPLIRPPYFDDLCLLPPSGCQFLLPIFIAEQESKARIHFIQLLSLAQRLNRTLILPDVGKSRLGGCLKKDFNWYYDLDDLKRQIRASGMNVGVVEMKRFKKWMYSKYTSVQDGRFLSIGTKSQNTGRAFFSDGVVQATVGSPNSVYGNKRLSYCSKSKFRKVDLSVSGPVYISPSSQGQEKDSSFGDSVVNAILALQASENIPVAEHSGHVLAVNWNLRHRIFLPSLPPPLDDDGEAESSSDQTPLSLQGSLPILKYSKSLHSLASKLSPPHPYLAIHWRMETVDPAVLPRCARDLVWTTSQLLSRYSGVETIWFASDYPNAFPPSSGLPAGSTTFHTFTPQHDEAIAILRLAFNGDSAFSHDGTEGEPSYAPGASITGVTERIERLKKDGNLGLSAAEKELLQDSGALGILDKIIATNADVFVAGNKNCARYSSYTRQIVNSRRESTTRIGKVVEWFGQSPTQSGPE